MSKYESDPRVVFQDDGSAVLPDPVNGDWVVYEDREVWVAYNGDQGFLHSEFNADFRATFRSRDAVLERILGVPQVSA